MKLYHFSFGLRVLCVVLQFIVCHNCAVANTKVTAWGLNNVGQTNVPPSLTNAAVLTAGTASYAIRSDGTLTVWPNAQLPPSATNVVQVVGGLALRSDGTLVQWYGPAAIPTGLTNVFSIAAGVSYFLALRADGTVIGWGYNNFGQLNVPAGLAGVSAIAADGQHNLALKSDGTVVAWGSNLHGEGSVPPGLTNVIAIAAGTNHNLALRADGTVIAWGDNSRGQTNLPSGLTNIVQIAAGGYNNLALRADGALFAWGDNSLGQTNIPAGLTNIVGIAVGGGDCLVLSGELPPFITGGSPWDSVLVGANVRMGYGVAGSPPLTYYWSFDGIPLPASTSTELVLNPVRFDEAGLYSLTASNQFGTTTSSNISLVVNQIAAWGRDESGVTDVPVGLTNVVAIAAGALHNLALTTDGLVHGWGQNAYGQATPPQDLSNVVAIAAGAQHSLALKADGTVVAWGDNSYGQTDVPPGLSNAVVVSAGYFSSMALQADGTAVVWGDSAASYFPGGLTNLVGIAATRQWAVLRGDGGVAIWGPYAGPARPDLTNVAAIAGSVGVSVAHTLALRADGTVEPLIWAPVPTLGSNIVSLASSELQDLGLRSDGTLYVWPSQGSFASNSPPGLSNVVAVASGSPDALALIGSGPPFLTTPMVDRTAAYALPVSLYASATGSWPLHYQWRFNSNDLPGATNAILNLDQVSFAQAGAYSLRVTNVLGALTSASLTLRVAPMLIIGQPQPLYLALGGSGSLTVAALGQGLTYQWQLNGQDLSGQTNSTLVLTNVGLEQAGNYTVIISNNVGTVTSQPAMVVISQLAAWGDNITEQTNIPPGLTNLLELASGDYHNLALLADRTVRGWGSNTYAEADSPPGLTNVIAVAAGGYHSVALLADGTVAAWGLNSSGQTNVPTALTNVVRVAAGLRHSVALITDGTVRAWGDNTYGQTNLPATLTNVVAIAAGDVHSLALRADGTVVVWGDNSLNQLSMPNGLSNVVQIAAGDDHNLVLQADGSLVAWGETPSRFGITSPPTLQGVVGIAAGASHDLALLDDGTVSPWGDNSQGQLNFPPGISNVIAICASWNHSLALLGSAPLPQQIADVAPALINGHFTLSIPTRSGRTYALEYKDSLADPGWTALPLVAGTGGIETLTDPTASSAPRFYRIRRW